LSHNLPRRTPNRKEKESWLVLHSYQLLEPTPLPTSTKKITRSRNLLRRFSGAIANPVPFADLQVAILWMGASHFNFSLGFEPLSVRFERANQVAWAGAGKQTTLPLRNVNKPSTSPLVKFAE
jgi:hypothetical protein